MTKGLTPMSKTVRSIMAIFVIGLVLAAFPSREVSAKTTEQWDYFKDHPCYGGNMPQEIGRSGLEFDCLGMIGEVYAWIMVPLVAQIPYQLPAVTMVYSMTGLQFDWAPLPVNYFQEGLMDEYVVTPGKEYYADIHIHPYLYQIPIVSSYTGSLPMFANIGKNIQISLMDKDYVFGEYYSTVYNAPIGIAIGGEINSKPFFDWSFPYQTTPHTGPSLSDINNFISVDSSFYLNNKSSAPTSTFPYYDFDPIHGAWFLSTMSSVYGGTRWNGGRPAFRLGINYMVELRAWVEPRQHWKYETRMVSPEEKGWVCHEIPYPVPPFPGECTTPDGNNGYWSFDVIKQAEYKTGYWQYAIDPAKDWGGINVGGIQEPTVDSSANCSGCRQQVHTWMSPDLMMTFDYDPILVYESRPLSSPPW